LQKEVSPSKLPCNIVGPGFGAEYINVHDKALSFSNLAIDKTYFRLPLVLRDNGFVLDRQGVVCQSREWVQRSVFQDPHCTSARKQDAIPPPADNTSAKSIQDLPTTAKKIEIDEPGFQGEEWDEFFNTLVQFDDDEA